MVFPRGCSNFYFQALNKKEHKGCESPEMESGDIYPNSLSIEEKYNRMNEEYQRALHHQSQMRVNVTSIRHILSHVMRKTTM